MRLRARVRAIVDDVRFQRAIIVVIVINSLALGAETSTAMVANYGELLKVLDHTALTIFVIELLLRLYAYRSAFFKDAWNWFDFLVVAISLLPAGGALSVVRSLRILRALRLISMVPSMRRVVSALLRAIPGIVALLALMVLMLYVGGVMASNLFGDSGDPRFDNLGATILSLFQITTGDGWSDIMRDLMQQHPMAWLFFVVYLLVGTFTMLNLFIAVVCSAMEPEIQAGKAAPEPTPEHVPEQRSGEQDATLQSIHEELRALRTEVAGLRARAETQT